MNRMLPLLIGLCIILASPFALAQENRFEVNGLVGYSFSSGIDIEPQDYQGKTIDRISPASAFVFDLGLDVFLSEEFSLGFNFGQQQGKLRARVRGGDDIDFADMNVNNYHGLFTFHLGDEDSEIRPYIFGGLGATQYAPGDIEGSPTESRTRFSTTWGGGVKIYASKHFGFKGGVRWTPTYIHTTEGGIWCNPWWPWDCWHVGNDHFSHQFELTGGVVARF